MASDLRSTISTQKAMSNGRSVFSAAEWVSLTHSLRLSRREFQIIQAIFDDEIEVSIALRLGISAHTVHTYLERLYRKLRVNSRCELLVRVFRQHLDLSLPKIPHS